MCPLQSQLSCVHKRCFLVLGFFLIPDTQINRSRHSKARLHVSSLYTVQDSLMSRSKSPEKNKRLIRTLKCVNIQEKIEPKTKGVLGQKNKKGKNA